MAIFAMIIGLKLAGMSVALFEMIIFPSLGLVNVVLVFLMLKNVREKAV